MVKRKTEDEIEFEAEYLIGQNCLALHEPALTPADSSSKIRVVAKKAKIKLENRDAPDLPLELSNINAPSNSLLGLPYELLLEIVESLWRGFTWDGETFTPFNKKTQGSPLRSLLALLSTSRLLNKAAKKVFFERTTFVNIIEGRLRPAKDRVDLRPANCYYESRGRPERSINHIIFPRQVIANAVNFELVIQFADLSYMHFVDRHRDLTLFAADSGTAVLERLVKDRVEAILNARGNRKNPLNLTVNLRRWIWGNTALVEQKTGEILRPLKLLTGAVTCLRFEGLPESMKEYGKLMEDDIVRAWGMKKEGNVFPVSAIELAAADTSAALNGFAPNAFP